jgi:hypothetical protein
MNLLYVHANFKIVLNCITYDKMSGTYVFLCDDNNRFIAKGYSPERKDVWDLKADLEPCTSGATVGEIACIVGTRDFETQTFLHPSPDGKIYNYAIVYPIDKKV